VETPLVGQDSDGQGPAAAVRKWGRSVSIMLDHGGTVRRCTSHMSPVGTIGAHTSAWPSAPMCDHAASCIRKCC